jgi:DNA-binding transcriptional LysR family regulator
MDIKRLEVFCKVVELKSFTRAAEAVLLAQPTVSEIVRQLEETFGEKLLDRLGREVLPTPVGEVVYRYALGIVGLQKEAFEAVASFAGTVSGTLRIGAGTVPGTYLLPRLLESFRSLYPSVRFSLKIAGTARVVEELAAGGMELAVTGAVCNSPLLEWEQIFVDEMVLTVFPQHPWARRDSVAVEELAGEPFLLREEGSGTRTALAIALGERGFEASGLLVVAEMDSSEAIRQGIRARLGISILSSLVVAEDLAAGLLVGVPLQGVQLKRPLFLARRRNRQLSPSAASFLDHLRASLSG